MNKSFYKRLSQIILEADEEEKAQDNEDDSSYQMDEADFEEEGGEPAEQGEEMEGGDGDEESSELTEEDLDDQTNDYQMDDSDFEDGSEGEEGMEGEEEGFEGEEVPMDEETDEQNNNESSKKYMLAAQYKEMLIIVSNLEKSMNNRREMETNPEDIHYIYIVLDKINNLKSKINFYVINNFITKPYEDLLSSFLFLKKELELIISLVEKLLEEKEEK